MAAAPALACTSSRPEVLNLFGLQPIPKTFSDPCHYVVQYVVNCHDPPATHSERLRDPLWVAILRLRTFDVIVDYPPLSFPFLSLAREGVRN